MLFLGLGTGLGAAMVLENVAHPLELAHLPYRKGKSFEDYVGEAGLERRGKKKWRASVFDVVDRLQAAMLPDYTVTGGGNVEKLDDMPRRQPLRLRRRLPALAGDIHRCLKAGCGRSGCRFIAIPTA